MNLIEVSTGGEVIGIIERLSRSDVKSLRNNKRFGFDWSEEANNDVYSISVKDSEEIIGLISLIDYPTEFRIHINLIESSLENQGKGKQYDHIPGCLIAYACRLSFEKGYEGFVSLLPKTLLIKYYREKFGFIQMGFQMAVYMEVAQSIINKYLNDEKV